MSNVNDFGIRMKSRRQQLDMTLRELAAKCGTTGPSYFSEVEQGKTIPSIQKAMDIANALKVSVSWLLGETEDSEADKGLANIGADGMFYNLLLTTHVFPNGLTYAQMEEKLKKLDKMEKLFKED